MPKLICETEQEYAERLLTDIKDCQNLIGTWEELARKHPRFTEEFAELIDTEKDLLREHQGELNALLSAKNISTSRR